MCHFGSSNQNFPFETVSVPAIAGIFDFEELDLEQELDLQAFLEPKETEEQDVQAVGDLRSLVQQVLQRRDHNIFLALQGASARCCACLRDTGIVGYRMDLPVLLDVSRPAGAQETQAQAAVEVLEVGTQIKHNLLEVLVVERQ